MKNEWRTKSKFCTFYCLKTCKLKDDIFFLSFKLHIYLECSINHSNVTAEIPVEARFSKMATAVMVGMRNLIGWSKMESIQQNMTLQLGSGPLWDAKQGYFSGVTWFFQVLSHSAGFDVCSHGNPECIGAASIMTQHGTIPYATVWYVTRNQGAGVK